MKRMHISVLLECDAGLSAMDAFVHMFLRGESLSRLFVHNVSNAASYVSDPITDTVCTMINTPVAVVLSANGLMPLQHTSNIVFPYAYMTRPQREYICALLDDAAGETTLARRCNCVEVRFAQQPKTDTFIGAGEVLFCMCDSLIRPHADGGTEQMQRLNICNVLLQRVRCSIHVSCETVVGLQSRLRVLFPTGRASLLQEEAASVIARNHASAAAKAEGSRAHLGAEARTAEPPAAGRQAPAGSKRPRDAVAPLGVGV